MTSYVWDGCQFLGSVAERVCACIRLQSYSAAHKSCNYAKYCASTASRASGFPRSLLKVGNEPTCPLLPLLLLLLPPLPLLLTLPLPPMLPLPEVEAAGATDAAATGPVGVAAGEPGAATGEARTTGVSGAAALLPRFATGTGDVVETRYALGLTEGAMAGPSVTASSGGAGAGAPVGGAVAGAPAH